MRFNRYFLIAGGLVVGLLGGVTLGVSQADSRQSSFSAPEGWIMTVADKGKQEQPVLSVTEIIERLTKDGGQVFEIERDREMFRDIYEVEMIDAEGKHWDLDVDARSGEILSRHRERDWD